MADRSKPANQRRNTLVFYAAASIRITTLAPCHANNEGYICGINRKIYCSLPEVFAPRQYHCPQRLNVAVCWKRRESA
jgi:hypothetical protein